MVTENKYYIKNDIETDFSLFGAFPCGGSILFKIGCDGAESVKLVLHSDGLDTERGEKYLTRELVSKNGFFFLCLSDDELHELSLRGLYYYHYEIVFNGEMSVYAGESSVVLEKDGCERQLLLYSENFDTPDFLKGGAIYHVFVDRFVKSGKCKVREGGRFNPDFENGTPEFPEYRGADFKNNEFFGGDLYGVCEKLDFICDAGFTTLYLSPIFSSVSNHKYDTEDYMKVDDAFGGDEALLLLIKECKKRNMHIILDGVFNHTGADSVYFDLYNRFGRGAYSCENSPYKSWYYFGDSRDEYACWWGIKILPKVNCDDSGYRRFVFGDNGIVRKYMRMGIDGFRLDVADELSDGFLSEMRKTVKEENADGILIGEVWEDASNKIAYSKRRYYFSGFQLDSVMNYPLREGIIAFIKYGDYKTLCYAAEGVYRHYPKCVSDSLMNFLGTHDTERILTVLAGKDVDGLSNNEISEIKMTEAERKCGLKMLRCAYGICAFMYGVPSVFYGDEAGLEGYHDPFCRKPYPWGREDSETLDFFSRVNLFRKREPLFKDGFFRVVFADSETFVFERFSTVRSLTVVITRSRSYSISFEEPHSVVFGKSDKTAETDFEVGAYSVSVFLKN